MAKYYYKGGPKRLKRLLKSFSFLIFLSGIGILFYVLFPLISWQVYFAPAFASQNLEIPIPKYTVVSNTGIESLLSSAANSWSTDFTDAENWYPSFMEANNAPKVSVYKISIPKIGIQEASVSTVDSDLISHLVQINTGTTPPQKGNSIIFGHSTLPQLFDQKNYKTIFANAYKLNPGDNIKVVVSGKTFTYKIISVIVVDAEDTSVLAQDFSGSYLTLITCTPPGTIWKRLVIKSVLIKNG